MRKGKGRKGEGDSLDLITGKNFQKNYVLFTKSFSPWTHCMENFCHSDPYAPSNLEYAPQPLKYAKMH